MVIFDLDRHRGEIHTSFHRDFSQKCMCACLCATSRTKLFSHHLHTGFSCFYSAVPLLSSLPHLHPTASSRDSEAPSPFQSSVLQFSPPSPQSRPECFLISTSHFFPLTFASHSSMFLVLSAYWKRWNCRSWCRGGSENRLVNPSLIQCVSAGFHAGQSFSFSPQYASSPPPAPHLSLVTTSFHISSYLSLCHILPLLLSVPWREDLGGLSFPTEEEKLVQFASKWDEW